MKHNFSYVLHTHYSIHVMKNYTITIGKNNCCNKLMRTIIRTEPVVFVSIMMLCSDHEYEYLILSVQEWKRGNCYYDWRWWLPWSPSTISQSVFQIPRAWLDALDSWKERREGEKQKEIWIEVKEILLKACGT